MSLTNCPKCEAQVDNNNNFCGTCGAAISQPPLQDSNDSPAVVKLIKAIELTLRSAPVVEQLEAYSAFLTTESTPDEMALACALKMRCHAQLGQFADAQESRRRARQYYAAHLGLEGDVLQQYLSDTSYVDEAVVIHDAAENPWLFYLLGDDSAFSAAPYMMQGDSDEERNNHAMSVWSHFGNDKDELLKVSGVLHMRAGRHQEAAAIFESLIRHPDTQSSEVNARMRVGLYWINFLAAECHSISGNRRGAVNRWQQARSFEYWRDTDPRAFDILASGWVEKAKDALRRTGITPPTSQDLGPAAIHLSSAWQWMLRAEAEMGGLDLSDFATLLNNPDNNFKRYTAAAEKELQAVERYDPFARAEVLAADGETRIWIRYDIVKGQILQYWGFVHLGIDDFDAAIHALNKSLEVWPSLGTYLWLGFAHEGKGAVDEAQRLYRLCIDRAAELANFMEDEQDQEGVIRMATALLSQLTSGTIDNIYIYKDGQQHGPYPAKEVRAWLASGRLQASDLAWYEGASSWKPLSSVPGLDNV